MQQGSLFFSSRRSYNSWFFGSLVMVIFLLGVWNWHFFVGHFILVLCLDPCTPILRYVILSSVKQRFYVIVNDMHSLLLRFKKRLVEESFLSDLVGILVLCGFVVCAHKIWIFEESCNSFAKLTVPPLVCSGCFVFGSSAWLWVILFVCCKKHVMERQCNFGTSTHCKYLLSF